MGMNNASETTTTNETAGLVELMREMGYSPEAIAAKLAELEASARRPLPRSRFRATIYRVCPCGETAHDYAAKNTYRCRNCSTTRVVVKRNATTTTTPKG